jgi:hypothetical protein
VGTVQRWWGSSQNVPSPMQDPPRRHDTGGKWTSDYIEMEVAIRLQHWTQDGEPADVKVSQRPTPLELWACFCTTAPKPATASVVRSGTDRVDL